MMSGNLSSPEPMQLVSSRVIMANMTQLELICQNQLPKDDVAISPNMLNFLISGRMICLHKLDVEAN